MNDAVVQLLDDFSMVTFTPLDVSEEESIEDLLLQVDMAIQVGAGRCRRRAAGRRRRAGRGGRRASRAAAAAPASRRRRRGRDALPCTRLVPAPPPPWTTRRLSPQYGEDQEVKAQELGDMADPVEPDD